VIAPRDTARGAVLVLVLLLVATLIAAFFALVGHVRAVTEGPDYPALVALRAWISIYVRARWGSLLDAEDLTAEVLLRAAESWQSFRPKEGEDEREALRRWVTGIARNTIAERARNDKSQRGTEHAYVLMGQDSRLVDGNPARVVFAGDLLSVLRDSTSPDNWRLTLLHGEGYTAREIAAQEGVSQGRVEWRLRQAQEDFARVLATIARIEKQRGKR